MKKLLPVVALIAIMTFSVSCKKEKKGCTDPNSLNYDASAKKDDGSCLYPSDKLTGNYNVSEKVAPTGDSAKFTANITKIDNTNVSVQIARANQTPWEQDRFTLTINYTNKTLADTVTTITGSIINDNSFSVTYTYGLTGYDYKVSQVYTRQ